VFLNTQFLIQFLILIVSPIPGYDKIYKYDKKVSIIGSDSHHNTMYRSDYIFAFMFLRLYFLYKVVINYNGYNTQFVK